VPQGAVMIDLGESQVLEGHMAHSLDSRFHIHRAVAHLLE
jgi:hypothetical protein